MDIFEQATRNKIRFPYKGLISTEDLWCLTVQALDGIYKTLNASYKSSQEESLLGTKTVASSELSLQISVVKHIVETKLAEEAKRKLTSQRAQEKAKLLEILAAKQDASLQGKSEAEIQKMINDLDS